MTESLYLYIDATPKPSPRPRHSMRNGFSQMHMPPKYNKHKKQVIPQILEQVERQQWVLPNGGLFVFKARHVLPRPKNHWSAKGGIKPRFLSLFPLGTGDLDNYNKTIMDAISDSKVVWEDDKYVIHSESHKMYEDATFRPGYHITISLFDGELFDDV